MGLDMYLDKRTSVRNWPLQQKDERYSVSVKQGGKRLDKIQPKRITHIIEEIGYWRKFNALHRWFVENVQEGNDDCKQYWVSQKALTDLLEVLKKVAASRNRLVENLPDTKTAEENLPTTTGFFFGDTDYNEYYYDEVDSTIAIIEEAVKDTDADYYYSSSW